MKKRIFDQDDVSSFNFKRKSLKKEKNGISGFL